ncbi:MAG TPA: hypothetical protein VFW98_10895 [Gemmatimonadaceae bacterium]|nr:hypothetical protein [Gemmatimonadaceae bacterium]
MPIPKDLMDEMISKRTAEAMRAERDKVRDLTLTALTCLGWSVLGVLCMLWSAHTTSLVFGKAAFYGGIAIGAGGILFTLLAAYRRGEKRGDW